GVVDPHAGRVERSFRLPVDRGLAYSDGLLWGWDFGHSALVGVDAATGHRQRSIALPGFSDLPMAADGSAAMLVEGPDGLARVDLRTGRVTATSAVAPLNISRDNAGRWWGVVVGGTRVACLDGRTLRMLGGFRVRSVDGLQVLGERLYASDPGSAQIVAYVLSQLRGVG